MEHTGVNFNEGPFGGHQNSVGIHVHKPLVRWFPSQSVSFWQLWDDLFQRNLTRHDCHVEWDSWCRCIATPYRTDVIMDMVVVAFGWYRYQCENPTATTGGNFPNANTSMGGRNGCMQDMVRNMAWPKSWILNLWRIKVNHRRKIKIVTSEASVAINQKATCLAVRPN